MRRILAGPLAACSLSASLLAQGLPRYKAAGAWWWYIADKDETLASFVDRLATLPFEAQPGERFVYGFSTDVLGCVVEVVSGQSLDSLFEERIFRPLKMPDTSFFLPPAKRDRLATVYGLSEAGTIVRGPEKGWAGQGDYVDGPRRCLSGGAGLLSTAADYGRFLQMLLNGGALDGVRLLSPKTVALATSNPEEKLVAFFLTQLIPAGDYDLHRRFRTLVYPSITGKAP